MEFNKNYDVTNLIKDMADKKEIFCYKNDSHEKVYVYEDVLDFGILRIQKNINENFQYEEGMYMVERNLFDKYDFIDSYNEQFNTDFDCNGKRELSKVIDSLPLINVVKTIIVMNDNKGLENEDFVVAHSLGSAIEFALDDAEVILMDIEQ